MRTTGRITGISRDIASGRYVLTIDADARVLAGYEDVKDKVVDVLIRPHREKRSLDQNAVYWSYVTQLAGALGHTNAWMHNFLIGRYGVPFVFRQKLCKVYLPDGDPSIMESDTFHVAPTSDVFVGKKDGVQYRWHIVMRGSSSYDKRQMARLIDGAVREAKEMGVHLYEIDHHG